MLDFLKNLFRDSKQKKIESKENATISIIKDGGTHIYIGTSTPRQNDYEVSGSPTEIYTHDEFSKAVDGGTVKHDLIIRDGMVVCLAPVTYIQGTLGLSDCQIESLSPLQTVHADIWCSYHDRKPVLKTLGTLKRVEGNASFRYTPLEDLGDLEYVGGDLSLRDTCINDLGKLSYVGGNLYLPMRLKDKLDLSGISVSGQIRYWNDAKKKDTSTLDGNTDILLKKSNIPVPYWPQSYIYPDHDIRQEPVGVQQFYKYFKDSFLNGILLDTEGYSNYYFLLAFDLQKNCHNPLELAKHYDTLTKGYPKLRNYCDDILIELYNENHLFEKAWNIVQKKEYLSIKTIYQYVDLIGDQIFDGSVAAKVCGTGCLTSFGKKHVDAILPFFRQCLQSFEKDHSCRFFDVFFDKGKGYKAIEGKYDPEYYRQFYQLDEGSFNYYDEIGKDAYHSKNLDEILVVEHAVAEQLRVLLIDAEDAYRESIGVPKIGEGWINETALFYKIKEHYSSYKVIQHGHPKWLGKQHLDVYFTVENIGIEYQGIQHYKPVDYFGGEEGFINNQERDERKRLLCKENHCPLIFVNEGYDFMDVVAQIDEALNKQNRKLKTN